MKERINPETGKPECTVTKADQQVIAAVRNLLRRIILGRPAEIVYAVQEVTVADDGEYLGSAVEADVLLAKIGWPKQADKEARKT